jgi:hypothetical protein
LGVLEEPSYRLYNCARCAAQVRICRSCDHGNVYCAGPCARIRRRECARRAGARYHRSRRGAHRHAARQRAYRARSRDEVTHQGSPSVAARCTLLGTAILAGKFRDDHAVEAAEPRERCAFCRAPLPPWARIRAGPWGRW